MLESENTRPNQRLGAVVLCGGKSTRLGVDKSQLLFQGQTFLERVVRQIQRACGSIVLVGDTDFSKHNLPAEIVIAGDEQVEKGPLEGIRVGLKRLAQQVDYAFVTSCDVPLLRTELIGYLFEQIGSHQAIVPVENHRVFGLTAIYQTELHQTIEQRIADEQLRVSDLANAFTTNRIDIESLKVVDPDLDSLTNVNSAADYFELLKRFGLECPEQFVGKFV
jgi:molybdopterin-guanine dinucleotide biosynthesis protein A